MRSKLSLAPLLAVVLFALSAAAENAPQAGGVQVLPTRVVFEGRERAAAITLVNNGQKAQTYRLSFVEMKMNDDGKLELVPAGQAVDHSAAQYIRFSPRQVTLEPKTTQTVRLQLRLPAELARGEYRSHLMLRALPDVDDAISMSGADSGMQIKLVPVYGVSIPVIFRVGDPSAQLSISELHAARSSSGKVEALEFNLNRSGDRSGYGDLVATWVPERGAPVDVAFQRGVGIYAQNPVRRIHLALPTDASFKGGSFRVKFTSPDGAASVSSAELPVR